MPVTVMLVPLAQELFFPSAARTSCQRLKNKEKVLCVTERRPGFRDRQIVFTHTRGAIPFLLPARINVEPDAFHRLFSLAYQKKKKTKTGYSLMVVSN